MDFNYHDALRIHGKTCGEWRASSPDDPMTGNSDQVAFKVVFTKEAEKRTLRLRISNAGIHHDSDRSYERRVLDVVKQWLDFEQGDRELDVISSSHGGMAVGMIACRSLSSRR
jgi:hypothetical protein